MTTRKEKKHSCLFCSFRYTLLVFVFVVVACQSVYATTYYVDAAAGGNSDGLTKENAWNTLQQVNDAMGSFEGGDSILFKRGSTFSVEANLDNTMLSITASGVKGSPIVFESYGNPNDPLPIIDGSQMLAGSWTETSLGSGVWYHTYLLPGPDNHRPNVLHYDGVPQPSITTLQFDSVPDTLLANAILLQLSGVYTSFWVTSVDSAANTVSGITFFDIEETAAVVALQLDASRRMRHIPESPLSTPKIIVSPTGLTQPGQWYWENGKIYLYSEESPDGMVKIGFVGDYTGETDHAEIKYPCVSVGDKDNKVHDVIVRDIKIQKCNESAIVLQSGTSNITVEGVEISDCGLDGIKLRDSSNNMISGNTIDDIGIGISIWAWPGYANSVGNEILNNTVSNCRTKCLSISFEIGVGGDPSEVSGNRIAGNYVRNANMMEYDSAGIYTFYAGSNTIESNIVENGGSKYMVSAGIMVDVSGGPMTIRKNTLENNSNAGIAVSGAGHQITDNILRNNGLPSWRMAQVVLFGTAGRPAENCRITGNTMEADQCHHFIYAEPGSQSGHFIDNNVYKSLSKNLFSWSSSWDEVWVNFKTWKGNTGHDGSSTLELVAYPENSCSRFPFIFMPAIISGSINEK